MTEADVLAFFARQRFGAIADDGTIVELCGLEGQRHQLADRARWIGGHHDAEIVKAALAMLAGRTAAPAELQGRPLTASTSPAPDCAPRPAGQPGACFPGRDAT